MKYMYLPLSLLISASYCTAMDTARMAEKYQTMGAIKQKLEGPCVKAGEKLSKNPHSKKAYARCMKCLHLLSFVKKENEAAFNRTVEEMENNVLTYKAAIEQRKQFGDYFAEYRAKHLIFAEEEALKANAEYSAEDDSSVKTELPNE
jgi:hypothetical protein